MGVLEVEFQLVLTAEAVRVGRLHEEVGVPLAAHVGVFVRQAAYDAAGASALGDVEVDVRLKATVEQGSLGAPVFDVRVAARAHGVLVLRLVAEGVVALRVEIFHVGEGRPPSALELRVDTSAVGMERAYAAQYRQRVGCRTACAQIYRRPRSVLRGRLAFVEFVGVVKRYRLKGRKRVFSQVDGTVLSVGEAYAVDVHAHMLRAERAHVDRLEASEASVVLDLYTGEIFEGIRNRRGRKSLQVGALDCLGGGQGTARGGHLHVAEVVHGVGVLVCQRGCGACRRSCCKRH